MANTGTANDRSDDARRQDAKAETKVPDLRMRHHVIILGLLDYSGRLHVDIIPEVAIYYLYLPMYYMPLL